MTRKVHITNITLVLNKAIHIEDRYRELGVGGFQASKKEKVRER